jgi:hypothetical protein
MHCMPHRAPVTKHMAALGDDDVLLALMAHIAIEQLPHGFHLLHNLSRRRCTPTAS